MSGSEEFRSFYEQHFRFVWRALRRLGINEQDTPDLLQKVFVAAHRKLPEFEHRSKVTTWLFGICLKVASTHREAAPQRKEIAVAEPMAGHQSGADPERELGERRRLAEAEQLLSALSPEQREVFVLYELEELTADEIAPLLQIPVGTVRSRLRTAREAFQKALLARRQRLGNRDDRS